MSSAIAASADHPAAPERTAIASAGPAGKNQPTPVCFTTSKDVAHGDILLREGRYAEARAPLQSVLDKAEPSKTDPADLACLMNMIAHLERQERRPHLAVGLLQRALELKSLPDRVIAVLTINLAGTYYDLDQFDSAEKLARQAVTLAEAAFGAAHPETLYPQSILALVHNARGEYARAEPVLRRILDQSEKIWGHSSYEVAQAAGNLAIVQFEQRKYELARVLLEESLRGLRVNSLRARDEIALTEASLGASCAAGGRTREANRWLERAMASAEQDLEPEHTTWPIILVRIGMARAHLRQYDSARSLFDRAIALVEARHGAGSQEVLDALEQDARLLRDAKDKRGARALEKRRRLLVPKR